MSFPQVGLKTKKSKYTQTVIFNALQAHVEHANFLFLTHRRNFRLFPTSIWCSTSLACRCGRRPQPRESFFCSGGNVEEMFVGDDDSILTNPPNHILRMVVEPLKLWVSEVLGHPLLIVWEYDDGCLGHRGKIQNFLSFSQEKPRFHLSGGRKPRRNGKFVTAVFLLGLIFSGDISKF